MMRTPEEIAEQYFLDHTDADGENTEERKVEIKRYIAEAIKNDRAQTAPAMDDEARADYREVFGKDPEPWRLPLGALRLTLAGDAPWTLERARAECEELVRVLNGEDTER